MCLVRGEDHKEHEGGYGEVAVRRFAVAFILKAANKSCLYMQHKHRHLGMLFAQSNIH